MVSAKKAEPKRPPLVEVRWLDSCSGGQPWYSKEQREEWQKTECECWSAGYLMDESNGHITLALSWRDTGSTSNLWAIPRSCVKSMRRIK